MTLASVTDHTNNRKGMCDGFYLVIVRMHIELIPAGVKMIQDVTAQKHIPPLMKSQHGGHDCFDLFSSQSLFYHNIVNGTFKRIRVV